MTRLIGDFLKEYKAIEKTVKQKKINSVIKALKIATPKDTGEAEKGWHQEGDKIVNPVEHIEFLNDGTSQQAPSHFIESTLLAQPGIRPSGTIVRSL